MIVTCPACRSRYRVEPAELARPGGRTVRCTACGHLWRYFPSASDTAPPAPAAVPPETPLEAPSRTDAALPPVLPRWSPWSTVGLSVLILVVVVAALAALYISR